MADAEKLTYHPLIRVRWPHGGWIVWNWKTSKWDHMEDTDGLR